MKSEIEKVNLEKLAIQLFKKNNPELLFGISLGLLSIKGVFSHFEAAVEFEFLADNIIAKSEIEAVEFKS